MVPPTTAPLDDPFLRCPKCGYDVRAVPAGPCPECGAAINHRALRQARLPWMHRAEIGAWRAFWRTVSRVTMRPGRMARETAGPVPYDEAVRFRQAAVLVGGGAITLAWMVGAVLAMMTDNHWRFYGLPLVVLFVLVPPVFLVLFLAVATGAVGYWMTPRMLEGAAQERSLALSQYASGPLALLAPAMLLGGIGVAVIALAEHHRMEWLAVVGVVFLPVAGGMLIVVPLAVWRASLAMAKHAAGRSLGARLAMAAALPILWVAIAALALGVVPGLLAWIGVMVMTLA